MDGAKGTSKTRGRKVATATISAPVMSSSRLKRSKKAEPIYAELSDDDAASKSTKKTSTNKVKKSAAPLEKAKSKTSSAQKGKGFSNLKQTAPGQLSDISEEDEEYNDGPPSSQNVKVSLLKDKLVVARPASFKSLDASDDDSEDNIPPIKSKSKSKVTSSQGKSQGKSCPVLACPHPSRMPNLYLEIIRRRRSMQANQKVGR
ncbi:hypothetical protein BYT27DRAFT_6687669 [Phlegmacium glaucopus]|nr:hypothetical protein BYT27DRAFT_6687669 [Phlegmacium glaucopus]